MSVSSNVRTASFPDVPETSSGDQNCYSFASEPLPVTGQLPVYHYVPEGSVVEEGVVRRVKGSPAPRCLTLLGGKERDFMSHVTDCIPSLYNKQTNIKYMLTKDLSERPPSRYDDRHLPQREVQTRTVCVSSLQSAVDGTHSGCCPVAVLSVFRFETRS